MATAFVATVAFVLAGGAPRSLAPLVEPALASFVLLGPLSLLALRPGVVALATPAARLVAALLVAAPTAVAAPIALGLPEAVARAIADTPYARASLAGLLVAVATTAPIVLVAGWRRVTPADMPLTVALAAALAIAVLAEEATLVAALVVAQGAAIVLALHAEAGLEGLRSTAAALGVALAGVAVVAFAFAGRTGPARVVLSDGQFALALGVLVAVVVLVPAAIVTRREIARRRRARASRPQ